MGESIKIVVDKITVSGPKVDGGYKITLEVGEYMRLKVAEILMLPADEIVEVSIKKEEK